MPPRRPFLLAALLTLFTSPAVFAQEQQPGAARSAPAAPTVAVSAAGARVRFTAVGPVAGMRVEVFDAAGATVSGSGFAPGGVRDWDVRGAQGQALPDGQYLCVVTVRDLSGRMSIKQGSILLQNGEASLLELGASEQAASLAAGGAGDALTKVDAASPAAVTITAHDGRDGQVTSTAGALTFRTGDVFAGAEKERMRVTPEGRVGVGTSDPQAVLDVAGAVRARDGFQFSDGSRLTVTAAGALVRTSADGSPLPGPSSAAPSASAAAATSNRLAKFLDPSGTLTDSAVTESGGNVGIGVASPGDSLEIAGAPNAAGRTGIRVRTTSSTGNSTLYFENDRGNFSSYGGLLTGGSANANSFFGVTRADRTFLLADGVTSLGLGIGTLPAQPLIFGTANTERMRVTPTGNVGIGITNPAARLHVAGNVNLTGLRTFDNANSPNVVGGFGGNGVTEGVFGATVGGGGGSIPSTFDDPGATPNRVTDNFGTVGGGTGNRAGDDAGSTSNSRNATVGGGFSNTAGGHYSFVGGGRNNAATGDISTVGGGINNAATGADSTIGGGNENTASDTFSTVSGGNINDSAGYASAIGGGEANNASGFTPTVGGGNGNTASGSWSTVPGGFSNTAQGDYSFAAGRNAQALNQGSFVWADSTAANFSSTANNQFLIRAGGGVGIVGNTKVTGNLEVTGNITGTLPAGSTSYIQSNPASQQSGANFNISGSGTLGGLTVDINTLHVDATNNRVGVGTTTPDSPLHVLGTARASILRASTNAGAAAAVTVGERYRDNALIGWGKILGTGVVNPNESFGITAVRDGTGVYTITLLSAPTHQSVPVAVAEVGAAPTSAAAARLVTIDQINFTQFKVYITNGSFAAVDNDFLFMVTGR